MTLIKHPETKATWDAPPSVVPFWTGPAGWELVDVDEPGPRHRTLVLARTKRDADRYAKDAGLTSRDYLYADGPDALTGLTAGQVTLAELPDFPQHRRHDAIVTALTAAGIRTTPTTPTAQGGDEDDPAPVSSTTEHNEE